MITKLSHLEKFPLHQRSQYRITAMSCSQHAYIGRWKGQSIAVRSLCSGAFLSQLYNRSRLSKIAGQRFLGGIYGERPQRGFLPARWGVGVFRTDVDSQT